MKRKKVFCLLCLVLLCGACSPGKNIQIKEISEDQLVDTSPVSGGTLEIPLTHMENVNPLLTKNTDYYYFSKLIYDSLFIPDALGNYKKNLAEHVEYSEDGYTLTVTLKEGIRWQDGQTLTAYDVADTFNAIRKLPGDNPYVNLFRHSITSCQAFDPQTFARAVAFDERNVDFQFNKPYRNVLQMLTFPILPSHLLTQDQMLENENFPLVGSGPFRYLQGDSLKEWVLEKNPNYWGRPAYIDKIYGKILNGKDQGENALETGQVDLSINAGYDWDKYQTTHRIRLEHMASNQLEFLAINTSLEKFQGESGRALRQAIHRGINKERIIDSLYLGKAVQTSSLVHPKSKYGKYIKGHIYYNLETARKILEDAGFKENDQGFFTLPDGGSLRLGITTNSTDYTRKATVDLIIDDLRRMGLDAYPAYPPVDTKKEVDKEKEKEDWENFQANLSQGNFDLALVGVQMTPSPDLASLLYSGAIGGTNIARYQNQEMDQVLQKISLQSVDEDEKSLYNNITELFYRDCPYVPLFYKEAVLLKDKRVRRNLDPSIYDLYSSVKDSYIPKEFQD